MARDRVRDGSGKVARGPLVGIVDSGGPAAQMADARAFTAEGERAAAPDRLGHGSAVAEVILRAAPGARLRHAQVFDDRPVTSPDRVARAVAWLAEECDIIVLSLGLAADRAVLRESCAQALAAGACLVAAHPARGAASFPAAYPGVIAASGDARCGWSELSLLPGGVIGAWCGSPEQRGAIVARAARRGITALPGIMGGASIATARVAAHLACGFPAALGAPQAWLALRAAHIGAERRRDAVPA